MSVVQAALDFAVPYELAAHEPPEARGLTRDGVRLMVSHPHDDTITHTQFTRFPDFLDAGDVLVVNTSATINAAIEAVREAHDGTSSEIMLHLSTPISGRRWVIELRRRTAKGTSPLLDAEAGERIHMPAGGTAVLLAPYVRNESEMFGRVRLWVAELTLPHKALAYTAQYGTPIRYAYVPHFWPLDDYQTIFAEEPGSAEMPSAARPFTRGILDRMSARGVRVAPLVLHAGVASLEADEPPYPERFRVPYATAELVNGARTAGGRVVAVGTTAVRALETVASADGRVEGGAGWTSLVIGPERGLYAVDAILTGLHEAKASHLAMLEALAGREHLAHTYDAALRERYLWHEFGDLHLIIGDT